MSIIKIAKDSLAKFRCRVLDENDAAVDLLSAEEVTLIILGPRIARYTATAVPEADGWCTANFTPTQHGWHKIQLEIVLPDRTFYTDESKFFASAHL